MRIAILSSRFFPQLVGSGTSAYILADNLARRGHSVTVLTDASLELAHRLNPLPFAIRYIPDLELFATGHASMKRPLESLHQQLVDLHPEVLQVCNFMPMLLVDILRPSLDCPVVFTFFNTPIIGKRAMGYSKTEAIDLGLARHIIRGRAYDKLVLGSRHYMQAARQLGAHESTLQLSYLGTDKQPLLHYRPTPRQPLFNQYIGSQLADDDAYMILPSRITQQKGILEAVEALAVIRHEHSIKLLLTGMSEPFDRDYAGRVLDRADQLGVREFIVIPERHIPRNVLVHFFAHARMTIVPSYYEGLGLSAIESQIIGTPLIASDTVGLDEVVSNHRNGLTCKPRDPQSLADAITWVLQNPAGAARLAKKAKWTSQKFDTQQHIDDLEKVYSQVMDRQYA